MLMHTISARTSLSPSPSITWNVWVDLCWAWSIDLQSADFVRRFLHAVPSSKPFGFGGDTFWPTSAVAYRSRSGAACSVHSKPRCLRRPD